MLAVILSSGRAGSRVIANQEIERTANGRIHLAAHRPPLISNQFDKRRIRPSNTARGGL
jgi:hypothetical protein